MLTFCQYDPEEDILIQNNEIKIFLVKIYGDRMRFCPSQCKNESLIVFLSHLKAETLAATIRSQDAVRTAGTILKNALQYVDFGLHDKFCDASELRKSWESTRMPDVFLTLFSSMFNISKSKLVKPVQLRNDADVQNDVLGGMNKEAKYTPIDRQTV